MLPPATQWINGKNVVSRSNVAAYTTYGTDRANAYKILEDTLNLRDVRIYDTVQDADGKEQRVLNQKATTLAQQKQQAIKDAFREWIWKDPERRQTLVAQYNELFNSIRPREYDGSHIVFAGMNPEISLREHQRNAVAHVLYGGNTPLAHQVGAGKTFEMVAAAMESKRLGLCQKSVFVVPNHLTEQWASEFLRLYPSANILVATKKDFETGNRKKFCARIATGDYDAVIIGHSQFEKIPVSHALMQLLEEAGCRVKRGAQISIKLPGAKRFIRLDTVGAEYTEEALRMSLAGRHVHIPKHSRSQMTKSQVECLIDIEAKLRSGKGKGYERWAERHNTEALASSMSYLKENHVGSYAELESRIQAALNERDALKSKVRAAQARMEEISRQKKAILVYRRTKEVYAKFRESGWSPAFYREHKVDIEAHKEAQAVYSAADGKLPTLAELSEEYELLLSQKRQTGEELSRLSEELKNLRHIKSNLDTLLDDEGYNADQHHHNELNTSERDRHADSKDI